MVKRNKLITTGTLFIVLLLSITMAFNPVVSADESMANENSSPRFISFNSYITIDYDTTPLDQNLDIDQSINVPLTISYATDIPEGLFGKYWRVKNFFLYGSTIGPTQQITLEVLKQPDWADIILAQGNLLVDFPSKENPIKVETSLIFSPYEEAPAQPYTITIKATSKQFGRINGFSTTADIVFTPSFVPTVTIITEKPTRMIHPKESINFNIQVKNEANKKARIIPKLITITPSWSPTINPPFFDILPGEEQSFVFSVYTPYDFGWHNEIQSFQIDFTTQIFPLREDAAKGGPYSIFLRINNYGFSTPGFEIVPILISFGCVIIIVRKKFQLNPKNQYQSNFKKAGGDE
jgi:hypothetical protein